MIEVAKGINCYGNPEGFEQYDSLILVHPWFGEPDQRPETYRRELERVLLERKGRSNIILMEMAQNYWYALSEERLLPITEKDRVFLVPTHLGLPEPAFTDWKGLAEFLKQMKGDKFFVGGQYYLWGNNTFGGCLAGAVRELSERGIKGKVIEEATFR